jgi:hypothetical protein
MEIKRASRAARHAIQTPEDQNAPEAIGSAGQRGRDGDAQGKENEGPPRREVWNEGEKIKAVGWKCCTAIRRANTESKVYQCGGAASQAHGIAKADGEKGGRCGTGIGFLGMAER